MKVYDHFEIDIVSALSSQLVAAFTKLDIGKLADEQLSVLPSGQGIYKLYHDNSLVYVGKAGQLKRRLEEHKRKINGRRGIDASKIGFKCLFIHRNWTALAPETALIKHYRAAGEGECVWNGNGFGPHDPGRNRETTNKHPDGFDAQYPIREDWICDWLTPGTYSALELLNSLKSKLPYLLRFQKSSKHSGSSLGHENVKVLVSNDQITAEDLLRIIAQSLPGWQATSFPSHMILYKEQREYKHGRVIWPITLV